MNTENPQEGNRLTASEFEQRKAFSRFTKADVEILKSLRGVFEEHAEGIVEQFYRHLMDYPSLQPLLADSATVGRLKSFQHEYLLSLTSGEYGEDYAQQRLRIARVHDRIALEPQWYLGSYGLYLDLLTPVIAEHFKDEPAKTGPAISALSKLLTLDMQLVLDVYYGLQQKRAVERTEQLAQVGELAASIAHEVRNPLAGMKGALEVLRKELSVNPANLEIVDELLAQIVRLENLVRDLLSYSRPRAISRRTFDLRALLDRVLRSYEPPADAAGIEVHRQYGPGTGTLIADPTQIEQVFLNLIHNAIQAMEQGGKLTVVTRALNGSIAVTFRDTGKGIAPADLPKIYQPFFTTKHRGSGLGLPIVVKIIEAHGGALRVTSEAGGGTTATVTLPGASTP